MLDKCRSLCHKFPDDPPCEVCRRKAGIPPKAKRTINPRNEVRSERKVRTLKGEETILRQRYENRTWKFMKVRRDPKQDALRLHPNLRDFLRAHIARK